MKTLSTTIDIDASTEEVWATLIDFPSHERWNPFFARIEGSATVGEKISIVARKSDGGEGMGFTPTILEVEAGRVLRWKGKLLVKGIFDGEHVFELVDIGDGRTRLNHGENFGGILIPFMGKVLKETEEGFRAFNEALAVEVVARRGANCSS